MPRSSTRAGRVVEIVWALVAYGLGLDGHRQLLAVTIGAQESEDSWSELLAQLAERGSPVCSSLSPMGTPGSLRRFASGGRYRAQTWVADIAYLSVLGPLVVILNVFTRNVARQWVVSPSYSP